MKMILFVLYLDLFIGCRMQSFNNMSSLWPDEEDTRWKRSSTAWLKDVVARSPKGQETEGNWLWV